MNSGRSSTLRRTQPPVWILLALLICPLVVQGSEEGSQETDGARALTPRHLDFLEQVDLILGTVEREVFLGLSEDYRRDAFVREFWKRRDPYPRTARNEFEEAWQQQQSLAADRYPDRDDDRYRLMAAFGAPSRTVRTNCDLLRPLELWSYGRSGLHGEFWAILLRRAGRYELWSPSSGLGALAAGRLPLDPAAAVDVIGSSCSRGDEVVAAIEGSRDWLGGGLSSHLPDAGEEWARTFAARAVEFQDGDATEALDLEISYPGRHQSRTITRIDVRLPVERLTFDEGDGPAPEDPARQTARVVVDGEIVRAGELFETFRYRFDTPLDDELLQPGAVLPVALQRYLRPGSYQLRMRLRDRPSEREFRAEADLEVPSASRPRAKVASTQTSAQSAEALGELEELEGLSEQPLVRLVVPRDELLIGRVRIAAEASGTGWERIGFELDGKRLLTKRTPPYDVEVNIGRAPRMHELRAFALDAEGRELAEDTLTLNAGPNSFSVRLVQPARGDHSNLAAGSWIRALAEVEVPRLERLERLEFFLDDVRLATLYQPPFVQPLRVPAGDGLSFVRVMAYLESGGAAEDLVFLRAPNEVDYLDIDVVELWVSASDRRGRPVTDLERSELRLRQDGREVPIERFERLEDAPLHACILLDVSISMEERLDDASEAASAFFERVVREGDRACLMTFADEHELVVPFTGRSEELAGGLVELEADGETALYDSLIHTMFYFNGIRGKRALVLLSDGEDSVSDYNFTEVQEFARRSGVAVYTIGLAITRQAVEARAHLSRLARDTGGRSYFVDHARELRGLYERIAAELHAQYLVTFQSADGSDEYHELDLDVTRKGVRVRTRGGYYP